MVADRRLHGLDFRLVGLVVSFHLGFASGPTIILTASPIYGVSLLLAPSGALRRLLPRPHLAG